MKAQHFQNIWKKENKMKCRLMSKVEQRGLKPTYEICRDYYMGSIKPYRNGRSGKVEYLHKKHDRKIIWRMKNVGRNYGVPRQDKPKKRRFRR